MSAAVELLELWNGPRLLMAIGTGHRFCLRVTVSTTEHILERFDVSKISETWEFPFQSDFEYLNPSMDSGQAVEPFGQRLRAGF